MLRNKKQEWEEYRSEVTAFELRRHLPVLQGQVKAGFPLARPLGPTVMDRRPQGVSLLG